jgi:hypothetical protein
MAKNFKQFNLQPAPLPTDFLVGYRTDGTEEFRAPIQNIISAGIGYTYVNTIYYTTNNIFQKASYPWLKAINVKCQAAGGAGGFASPTAPGEVSVGGGGGGGGYTETFITNILTLDSNINVSVPAGGISNQSISLSGGSAFFGNIIQAQGGQPGETLLAPSPNIRAVGGGIGGIVTSGQLRIPGGGGGAGLGLGSTSSSTVNGGGISGSGGNSYLGNGARGLAVIGDGISGENYGGGGSGAINYTAQDARPGGKGGDGLIIIELYA